MKYSHSLFESKWQKYWLENQCFKTTTHFKNNYYVLDMFPYPSGKGLHVGHPKGYTATDVIARNKKLCGFNVLHPIGWDAFGLPAEQYAIQNNKDPNNFTLKNINKFRDQLQKLGFMYDYSKEINTSNPDYFKTTQYIFTLLFKNNIAQIKNVEVNWCPELKTVLANEEIVLKDNKMYSERGNYLVVKKMMKQWILKITNYADRLLAGLDDLDWPKSVKQLQKKWIGKQEGYEINFSLFNTQLKIPVFIKNLNLINYGIGLAIPCESYLIDLLPDLKNNNKLKKFIEDNTNTSDAQRNNINFAKKIFFTKKYILNPLSNKKIPIYVTNHITSLFQQNTALITPLFNHNDFQLAIQNNLKFNYDLNSNDKNNKLLLTNNINNNLNIINDSNHKVISLKINQALKQQQIIKKNAKYKLKDWVFSRQRYWGEPIPIIHWDNNIITALEKSDLPLILPTIDEITKSQLTNHQLHTPLSKAKNWINVTINNKSGLRDSNTMPQWAGSCWYYIGYILQVHNQQLPIDSPESQKLLKEWLPVDMYIGGQEHAVLHLLYARFWNLVLFDLNLVPVKEPFKKLINQGIILGLDGHKMSKSVGNTICPDSIIKSHGADALRLYEMFMGPLSMTLPWSSTGLDGCRKWLDRVYILATTKQFIKTNNHQLDYYYHLMIKNIDQLLEQYKFNNCISQLMIFINHCYKATKAIFIDYIINFIKVLSIFCPHLSQELLFYFNIKEDISSQQWPKYDPKILVKKTIIIPIMINNKFKNKIEVIKDIDKNELIKLIYNQFDELKQLLETKKINKIIFVKNKIINFIL